MALNAPIRGAIGINVCPELLTYFMSMCVLRGLDFSYGCHRKAHDGVVKVLVSVCGELDSVYEFDRWWSDFENGKKSKPENGR